VLGFSVAPPLNGYSPERTETFVRQLTGELKSLPGVSSATAAQISTLTGNDSGGNVTTDATAGVPHGDSYRARRNRVAPDYFVTLGIRLLAGRSLEWTDMGDGPKVAVVNQAFARRYFSGASPIGRRFTFGGSKDVKPDIEIVGLVGDSKGAEVTEEPTPYAYLPYKEVSRRGELTFYLRSRAQPESLFPTVRETVRRLDPNLPIFDLKTLKSQADESLVTQRLLVMLSAAFGGLAALLAAIGIYGVLAFAVAQRRQEIGVRVALGADPSAVRRLVLGEVLRFLVAGAIVGLPAAYALGRAVSSLLYGVHAGDARVFGAGLGLMAAVALLAALPPALRASRVSATDALRSE